MLSLRSLFACVLLCALTGEVFANPAAPPLVWRHSITNGVEKARVAKYGVGPFADAQSRLETELQATIPLKELPNAKGLVDKLVKSKRSAEKVFGKGYRVVRLNKTPRRVADLYLDTPDGKLAKVGASLRIRVENGIAQVNFKPPGGKRFDNGMAHRVEGGINVKVGKDGKLSARTVEFLENTRLVDNPLREIPKLFPGLKARNFLHPQLQIKQRRAIYEVQMLEGGAWVKAGEITLDNVNSSEPGGKGKRASFGRVELEGEHVSLQLTQRQQQRLSQSAWKGPHTAADTHNPAFTESKDVKNIDRMGVALSKYLGISKAEGSKYGEARRLLKEKGVRVGSRKKIFRAARKRTTTRQQAKQKRLASVKRVKRSKR